MGLEKGPRTTAHQTVIVSNQNAKRPQEILL
jgi:hypothetical protein